MLPNSWTCFYIASTLRPSNDSDSAFTAESERRP
jgi:hypothetical protein